MTSDHKVYSQSDNTWVVVVVGSILQEKSSEKSCLSWLLPHKRLLLHYLLSLRKNHFNLHKVLL
jgi:hypothetical protein